ncbi:hypothetical protein J7K93_06450 [bacterium]|nr:hypothetical protein [bacterium]
MRLQFIGIIMILLLCNTLSIGQENEKNKSALKIFIDCEYCDFDFIREEIPFVNYVNDYKEADVHILITSRETGSGGRECSSIFIGEKQFEGKNDTLLFYSKQTDTEDDFRIRIVKILKIGLMPYVAKTSQIDNISINYKDQKESYALIDKWNYWVFRTNLSGFINGEKSSKSFSYNAGIRAQRITEAWKIRSSWGYSYDENKFIIKEEQDPIISISRSWSIEALIVKSIGRHWSAGVVMDAGASTYRNLKNKLELSPALEFNIFPYSESTRKELRFLYNIGYEKVWYRNETIYNKFKENLIQQSLRITLDLKQPWGNSQVYVQGSQFFHDLSKYHVDLKMDLSVRLFKGFSLFAHGGYSRIHDQISIPKEDISIEEILLQRRELETQYSFWGGVGFEYTFGSMYNNIVNPRFGE